MSISTSFTNLPLELFQEILLYLDCRTIWSFRLANRSFKEACSGPPWLRFLTHLTAMLNDDNLTSLELLISRYNLKHAVRRLTILAPCKYELTAKEALEWQQRKRFQKPVVTRKSITKPMHVAVPRDLHWLFTHGWAESPEASRYAAVGRLTSILCRLEKLDTVRLEPAMVWESSVIRQDSMGMDLPDVHFMTLMAMARSNTPVTTLNIFRNPSFSAFCYGGLNDAVSLYSPELMVIGERLRTLKLSIAAKKGVKSGASDGTTGLASFLQFTPHLRQLDLDLQDSYFNQAASNAIFVSVANEVYLPRLEECRLSGFWLHDTRLIRKLLTKHSKTLQWVTLDGMNISSGSWQLVLHDFVSRDAFPVFRNVHVRMLRVGGQGTCSPPTVITRSESGEMEEKIGWGQRF